MGFKFEGNGAKFQGAIYVGAATHIKVDGDATRGYDVFSDRSHTLYPPKHVDTLKEALDYVQSLEVNNENEKVGNLMHVRSSLRRAGVEV